MTLDSIGQLTENPFASTHSLDMNPFDDPVSYSAATSSSNVNSTKLQDLEQRERDLERRESELNQRAEQIRTHGRNNWPPCPYSIFSIAHKLMASDLLSIASLPSSISLHSRRNTRRFKSLGNKTVPAMVASCRHTYNELRRISRSPYFRSNRCRRWICHKYHVRGFTLQCSQ